MAQAYLFYNHSLDGYMMQKSSSKNNTLQEAGSVIAPFLVAFHNYMIQWSIGSAKGLKNIKKS